MDRAGRTGNGRARGYATLGALALAATTMTGGMTGCAMTRDRHDHGTPRFDPRSVEYTRQLPSESLPRLDEILALARNADILVLGEDHATQADNEYAAFLLGQLTPLGYATLAIETDPAKQYLIDRYMAGRLDLEASIKGIMKGRGDPSELQTLMAMPAIGSILDAARLDGYTVAAIAIPLDYGAIDRSMRERESSMAQRVGRFAQESKVVVFVGAAHALKEPIPGHYAMAPDTDGRRSGRQIVMINDDGSGVFEPLAYRLSKRFKVVSVDFTDVAAGIRQDIPSYNGHADLTVPMR